jgi:hypothetical protein
MLVRIVIVIVVMVVMLPAGIGAGFRVEWCLDRIDVSAEALHHRCDYMIGTDAEAIAEQLHRQVPVAEMPGDADQLAFVMRVDLQQRFRFRTDPDDAAVVEPQPVTMAQPRGLREIEQHLLAAFSRQQDAATMPVIEVDQHVIDFPGNVPASGWQYVPCAHQNRK